MTVLSGELLPAAPLPAASSSVAAEELAALLREWLIGYQSANTRDAYRRDVAHWLAFLTVSGVDPLTEARRVHTHAWLRAQESSGAATATRARRAVSAFYTWMVAEDHTDRANPAAIDPKRKPRVNPDRSTTAGLTRDQAGALLAAADADTGPQAARAAAIVALLLYTGLRVGELVGADREQLGEDRGHRVLRFTAKGDQPHLVALPAPVTRRLDAYLAGRVDLAGDRLPTQTPGARPRRPLVATASGGRLDRGAVWRLLKRLACTAGISVTMSPHVLRHTCATLARDAGARLEDIQDQLGHADVRTTRRYDHGGARLDRSPAYTLAGYLNAE
ncbi:tyrosine-type recombinase/integrase [Micromonospora sp. NBC_01655]|uniref:tyrosine-type recombinase/integrase n=1 Tax=Micromonospora sp. NBC_01655 TaxID=2975983 RepID=UPI00225AC535|nr:tyrosine-type recombinase/integrase [Micromonospora sp. NBC_01655]MCX4471316.1 tyrosine-type recombinase/integrase [Micromonospora sp. NBC_01655]